MAQETILLIWICGILPFYFIVRVIEKVEGEKADPPAIILGVFWPITIPILLLCILFTVLINSLQ